MIYGGNKTFTVSAPKAWLPGKTERLVTALFAPTGFIKSRPPAWSCLSERFTQTEDKWAPSGVLSPPLFYKRLSKGCVRKSKTIPAKRDQSAFAERMKKDPLSKTTPNLLLFLTFVWCHITQSNRLPRKLLCINMCRSPASELMNTPRYRDVIRPEGGCLGSGSGSGASVC